MAALSDRRIANLSAGSASERSSHVRSRARQTCSSSTRPTVGVDAESVAAFYDLLESLHEEGITVVLIEHDIGAVTDHADRVVCLNRTVQFDGPTAEFVESDAMRRAFGTAAALAGDSR